MAAYNYTYKNKIGSYENVSISASDFGKASFAGSVIGPFVKNGLDGNFYAEIYDPDKDTTSLEGPFHRTQPFVFNNYNLVDTNELSFELIDGKWTITGLEVQSEK